MGFFLVIFILSLIFVIYNIVTTMLYSVKSTGYKVLPKRCITERTRRGNGKAVAFCPKCGSDLAGKAFCANCGTSAILWQTYRVPIKGSITAQTLEKHINQFLAENPYISDCRLNVQYQNILMFPLVQLRFRVKYAELNFTLSDTPNNPQFGMAFLYKYRLFGSINYSTEILAQQWLQNNPDSTLISHNGSHIQHYSSRGNFEAHFYNYILFKKRGS